MTQGLWKHSCFCPPALTDSISRVTSSVAKECQGSLTGTERAEFAAQFCQPWQFCSWISSRESLYVSKANNCFVMPFSGLQVWVSGEAEQVSVPLFLPLDTRVWGRADADPAVASCTWVILRGLLITLVKALQKPLGWTFFFLIFSDKTTAIISWCLGPSRALPRTVSIRFHSQQYRKILELVCKADLCKLF